MFTKRRVTFEVRPIIKIRSARRRVKYFFAFATPKPAPPLPAAARLRPPKAAPRPPRNRPPAAPKNRPAGKSSFFAKKTLHCPENRGKMKVVGAKRPETAPKPLSARQPRRSDSRAEWRGSGDGKTPKR